MRYTITSRQNPHIVDIFKLKQKKYRDEMGLVVLEGERIIRDALGQKIQPQCMVVSKDDLTKFEYILKDLECDVYVTSKSVFNTLSNTQNSQGLLAIVHFVPSPFAMPTQNFLVLDGVQDPGNMGTIIRTAVALGYATIYLYNCVDIRNDKVLRSTMGTIFKAKLIEVDIDMLQQVASVAQLIVADMHGTDLKDILLNGLFGIVLGSEANGVSDEVSRLATHTVCIPMQNNVESLNVAVAGALLMYGLKSE